MKAKVSIFDLIQSAAVPLLLPELPTIHPEVIGTRLSDESVIELWEERSAIVESDNLELISWCLSQDFSPQRTRRYCELCAAADVSLRYGEYVDEIIQPLVTKDCC